MNPLKLSKSARDKILSVFILLFIAFQLFCGIRSSFTEERRLGWAMFAGPFLYRIRVEGLMEGGEKKRIKNTEYDMWVRGRAYIHLKQRTKLRAYWSGMKSFEDLIYHFEQELCQRSRERYLKIKVVARIQSMDGKNSKLVPFDLPCAGERL